MITMMMMMMMMMMMNDSDGDDDDNYNDHIFIMDGAHIHANGYTPAWLPHPASSLQHAALP